MEWKLKSNKWKPMVIGLEVFHKNLFGLGFFDSIIIFCWFTGGTMDIVVEENPTIIIKDENSATLLDNNVSLTFILVFGMEQY